jgi:2-polyprenyl-3-methyl-5-hydroxy-6-metoxy-1,4-benzoquinol methylase
LNPAEDGHPHHCPSWLYCTFDNPLRRLIHKPDVLFDGLLHPGDTAIDLGCGRGYFSLAMARLVGPAGKIIAVDVLESILPKVRARARRKGLEDRIFLHLAGESGLGITERADFVLAFWMIHEVRERRKFLAEVAASLKPEASFLAAEPKLHVKEADFLKTIALAEEAGLVLQGRPRVAFSRAALFGRGAPARRFRTEGRPVQRWKTKNFRPAKFTESEAAALAR